MMLPLFSSCTFRPRRPGVPAPSPTKNVPLILVSIILDVNRSVLYFATWNFYISSLSEAFFYFGVFWSVSCDRGFRFWAIYELMHVRTTTTAAVRMSVVCRSFCDRRACLYLAPQAWSIRTDTGCAGGCRRVETTHTDTYQSWGMPHSAMRRNN